MVNDQAETPILTTSLRPAVKRALHAAGVSTIEEAQALGRKELHNIWGIGEKALEEILAAPAPRKWFAFTPAEVDLFRQWFNALDDTTPQVLDADDHALAAKVMRALGL